jgi:hypothetical protein
VKDRFAEGLDAVDGFRRPGTHPAWLHGFSGATTVTTDGNFIVYNPSFGQGSAWSPSTGWQDKREKRGQNYFKERGKKGSEGKRGQNYF